MWHSPFHLMACLPMRPFWILTYWGVNLTHCSWMNGSLSTHPISQAIKVIKTTNSPEMIPLLLCEALLLWLQCRPTAGTVISQLKDAFLFDMAYIEVIWGLHLDIVERHVCCFRYTLETTPQGLLMMGCLMYQVIAHLNRLRITCPGRKFWNYFCDWSVSIQSCCSELVVQQIVDWQ